MTPGYIGPSDVPTYRMMPLMKYSGFSILRPEDPRWYARYDEQSAYNAIFRFHPLSPTHTFFAAVENLIFTNSTNPDEFKAYFDMSITNLGVSDEFKAYTDAAITNQGVRTHVFFYQSELTTFQGQCCVRYKAKSWAKSQYVNEPLVLTDAGFWVIHPSSKNTIIYAHYSERGKPEEITGELDKAGEDFLSKIILESAPDKK
jgi:hypothetical protein